MNKWTIFGVLKSLLLVLSLINTFEIDAKTIKPHAQQNSSTQKEITGRVTDENDLPIIGATV